MRHGSAKNRAFRELARRTAQKERQRKRILRQFERDIRLPDVELTDLVAPAVAHFNARQVELARTVPGQWERPVYVGVTAPLTLCHVIVNFIRHELLPYDRELRRDLIKHSHDTKQALKRRVYEAIAKRWPALAKAVGQQMRQRGI